MTPTLPEYPHSVIAEKSVVSAIFGNCDLLAEAPNLTDDHFHLPGPRTIFQALRHFIATSKPMDYRCLVEYLHGKDLMQRIGGPTEIASLLQFDLNPAKFLYHVATLNDKLARRMAIGAADSIMTAAYQAEDVAELLEATSAPITAIHDTLLAMKPAETMKQVVASVIADMHDRMEGKSDSMGIKTEIPCIDRKLRGIHKGQTTIISGYPSGGKSILGGQMCAEAFKDGKRTLFVSLEMSKSDLSKRLIAYVAGIKGMAITDPMEHALRESSGANKRLTVHDLSKISRATKTIIEAPFEIERLSGANEQTIAAVIRKHHRSSPLDVVCVDYAQRIRASHETKSQNREQQLSHASKVLADLAAELGFALLLLSQLNKEGAAKHAEALNEDCDLHLQIVQDPKTKEHVGIAIPKDRHHGMMGALLPVKLDEEYVRFIEITNQL